MAASIDIDCRGQCAGGSSSIPDSYEQSSGSTEYSISRECQQRGGPADSGTATVLRCAAKQECSACSTECCTRQFL